MINHLCRNLKTRIFRFLQIDSVAPETCPVRECSCKLSEDIDQDLMGWTLMEEYVYLKCPEHGRVYYVSGWAHGAHDPDAPGYMQGWKTTLRKWFCGIRLSWWHLSSRWRYRTKSKKGDWF
ncbi:MAG TPA: hypothetical protein VD973_09400 [Symbiobacteriaceae bacterium]|nr:hypothetical protein [Symbiobacteriaceae bacterium]